MNNINITLTTKEANFIAGLLNDLIEADIELTNMTTEEVQTILNKLSK